MSSFADRFLPAEAPDTLRRFVSYWNARRGTRLMPSFDDIDPTDIPWALSSLYVLRVVPGGEFVYRLAGADVERPYDRPLRGRSISDMYPPSSARVIQERWTRVAREPACCFTNTEHPSPRGTFIAAQRVTMPLGENGWKADHVLGIADFGRMLLDEEPLVEGAVIRDVVWANLVSNRISVETPVSS
ncbi:MAG: PAS domain-containing protein [Thalassobaculaceae bacterium]|nr:PAS domain-containing protein [Thalassobaculaceae bacterium]